MIPQNIKEALESSNLTLNQFETLSRYFGNNLLIKEAEDKSGPTIRDYVNKGKTGYEFAVFSATRPEVYGGSYGTEAGEKQINLFRALVNPYIGTSTGKLESMYTGADNLVKAIRDPYGNLQEAEQINENEYVIRPYREIYSEGALRYNAGFKYKVDEQGNTVLQDVVVDPYQKTKSKSFFQTILPIAAIALGAYYLGPTLAGGSAAAGTAGAGAAAGTGASLGTGLTAGAGGATGLTAGAAGVTGLTAPAGFALAPGLGTSLAAAGTGIGLLDGVYTGRMGETGLIPGAGGQGLQLPNTPSVSSMGGAQGLTVPVAGGTVTQAGFIPLGASPVLGDPKSFINNPKVLGNPVIPVEPTPISLQDALRAANTANQLLNQPQQPGMPMPMDQGGGMQARGVDYSGLLSLLQSRARTPNVSGLLGPAQIRYPSLLG